MASETDAETIKDDIKRKDDNLGFIPTLDKILSGGQDGDNLFQRAILSEPYELLVTTIFKDDGWLAFPLKPARTKAEDNVLRLVEMLRPQTGDIRHGARSSLFRLIFSRDIRQRGGGDEQRLSDKYIPAEARDFLFHTDPDLQAVSVLPAPYNELECTVQSRDPWGALVGMHGATDKCLYVSRQELYLFLFANFVLHVKSERKPNYWPMFGKKKKRKTFNYYIVLVRDYLEYFERRPAAAAAADQQSAKESSPMLRKYLSILAEVWLRRNVICRRSRLQVADLHFEIDHFDSKRQRVRGKLTQAYDDMRNHPGYSPPSAHLLTCVLDLTRRVCALERRQAKNMGSRDRSTPFRCDDCGFFRDSLFEFLTLGMLHDTDNFHFFVHIWLEYISESNLGAGATSSGDALAFRALVCRRWYVCVVLFDVFLFRVKKYLQSRLDAKELTRLEALILKVQLRFAPDGPLVQVLTDPDLTTKYSEFMPHEERGIFMSKHSKIPAPSYDRSERADLPQTLALAALSREIELDALVGGDLDSAKTLFSWFGDEGHINGGDGGGYSEAAFGGQFDHLSPELLKAYWRDPDSLSRMCVQRIDQEIDTQRATKKKRNASAAWGFLWGKLQGTWEFTTDTWNALLTSMNFAKKRAKDSTHDKLKKEWKILFDYDSTPQKPTVKAWCTLTTVNPVVAGTGLDEEDESGEGSGSAEPQGHVAFEQRTMEGNEVLSLDQQGTSDRLCSADGSPLGKVAKGTVCRLSIPRSTGSPARGGRPNVRATPPNRLIDAYGNPGLDDDGFEWVDASVVSVSRAGDAARVAWRKVTVSAKYSLTGLLPGAEHTLRVVSAVAPDHRGGQEQVVVFDVPINDADTEGRVEGIFETALLRLEDSAATDDVQVVASGKNAAGGDRAAPVAQQRIVGLMLEVAEVEGSVRASGTVVNSFDSKDGFSDIVALMQGMDGPEPGNRQYYENHSMLGPAREDLNLSPALTDVEQENPEAAVKDPREKARLRARARTTAQVRATLTAFNRAWSTGGQLNGPSLQVCFRILMQATGVRVHQLFELHTTPNFERGRDRRCCILPAGPSKGRGRRGVAFAPKVAEALLEPKSLSTVADWHLPLQQLLRKPASRVPCNNLASIFIFVVPLLVLALHAFFFDPLQDLSVRAIFDPLAHDTNLTAACCATWDLGANGPLGRLLSDQYAGSYIGNTSSAHSLSECCTACESFTRSGVPPCAAAVFDEQAGACLFHDARTVAAVAAEADHIGDAGVGGWHGRRLAWVVVPRSPVSRALDWLVHRVARYSSILLVVLLWVWTLGPEKCRMRRGRTGEGGRRPSPLSCWRLWGIGLREAMNVIPSSTLYVNEEYVDEALVELLEEAEERRRWPLTFLVVPRKPLTPAQFQATAKSSRASTSTQAGIAAVLGSERSGDAAPTAASVDSMAHYASVFEEALQSNHLRFVGTQALEPLSQWEIPALTELLVLVAVKVDSELCSAPAGGTTSGGSGNNALSLKDRGYDDGISYARGPRFAGAEWDPVPNCGGGGGGGSSLTPPLRNVHWFLAGLRQLGDVRNLLVVWIAVVPLPWFLAGLNYVPVAFVMLVGASLAAPSLIPLVGGATSPSLNVAKAALWFVGPAIAALFCSTPFLWLAGLFLITCKFRSAAVALVALVTCVNLAVPGWRVVSEFGSPLPAAVGLDLNVPQSFRAAVAAASASADMINATDTAAVPAWATNSGGAFFAQSPIQAEWLNAHEVQFVPSFNAFAGSQVALDATDPSFVCTVPTIDSGTTSDRGSPTTVTAKNRCTADAFGAALLKVKETMQGRRSLSSVGCESCYGAGRSADQCCNTCDELQRAYSEQGWDATQISGTGSPQCRREHFFRERSGAAAAARSRGGISSSTQVTHLIGWRDPLRLAPRAAAHMWAALVQPAAKRAGLSLVSPVSGLSENQVAWLGNFIKECYELREQPSSSSTAANGVCADSSESCESPSSTFCDVDQISAWAVRVQDRGKEVMSNAEAQIYWDESYGSGRDGDFQRALTDFLNDAVPCDESLAASDCTDWAAFVASRPIWLFGVSADDAQARAAIDKLEIVERVEYS